MGTHPYANSLIYKRHSVRKYTNEPVDNVRLEHILRAGMAGSMEAKNMLQGINKNDPAYFALIYTIDKDDDPSDPD